MAARVGVVGGGILGTVLSLRLTQAGHDVTLLERGPSLGGLAGTMDFGGHTVDRFYHVITPADDRMIGLAEEVGLGEDLRFAPVGVGFYALRQRRDRPHLAPSARLAFRGPALGVARHLPLGTDAAHVGSAPGARTA
jgi:protoporphyrinogen oxidase